MGLPPSDAHITLRQLDVDKQAAKITGIGAIPYGKYKPEDAQNLRESLEETFATTHGDSEFFVHMRLRKFLVTVSNTAGAVLACVSWALRDSSGKTVFQEQFYASSSAVMSKTTGAIKDEVHRAIVTRVAEAAHAVANGRPLPAEPVDTYTRFADAEESLPKNLVSIGFGPGFAWTVNGNTSYSAADLEPVQW